MNRQSETSDLDSAFERVCGLADSRPLAGIERSTSYGTPSLKVKRKFLARIKDEDTLVLMCPVEQKMLLLEISPEIYFETPHYVDYPVILIRLSAISDEELALRLEDAWRDCAPAANGKRSAR